MDNKEKEYLNKIELWNKNKNYRLVIDFFEERIESSNNPNLIYYYIRAMVKEQEFNKANSYISRLSFSEIPEDYRLDRLILGILDRGDNFDYDSQSFFEKRADLLGLTSETYLDKSIDYMAVGMVENENHWQEYMSDIKEEIEQKREEEEKLNNQIAMEEKSEEVSFGLHEYTSSLLFGGSAVFPENLSIDDQKVTWEKRSLFSKNSKYIQIKNITSVHINTSLTGASISIHSNGFGIIHASNFRNSDVKEIKSLIEHLQKINK
jgi:hypothetical protein